MSPSKMYAFTGRFYNAAVALVTFLTYFPHIPIAGGHFLDTLN